MTVAFVFEPQESCETAETDFRNLLAIKALSRPAGHHARCLFPCAHLATRQLLARRCYENWPPCNFAAVLPGISAQGRNCSEISRGAVGNFKTAVVEKAPSEQEERGRQKLAARCKQRKAPTNLPTNSRKPLALSSRRFQRMLACSNRAAGMLTATARNPTPSRKLSPLLPREASDQRSVGCELSSTN